MFATLEKEMVEKRKRGSLVVLKGLIEQSPLDSSPSLHSTGVLMKNWGKEERDIFNIFLETISHGFLQSNREAAI